jgi:hypothetical protein
MNNDLMKVNHSLGKQLELITKKFNVAIEGLNAIILEGSDNLNIAEKTLQEIKNCNLPQDDSYIED